MLVYKIIEIRINVRELLKIVGFTCKISFLFGLYIFYMQYISEPFLSRNQCNETPSAWSACSRAWTTRGGKEEGNDFSASFLASHDKEKRGMKTMQPSHLCH